MSKIGISGHLAYDHLLRYKDNFKRNLSASQFINCSFVLSEKLVSFGGCAGNIAYGLAQLGADFDMYGVLGSLDSNDYLDRFKKFNIPSENVVIIPNSYTACAYIATDNESQQLTFFMSNAAVLASSDVYKFAKTDYEIFIVSPDSVNCMIEAYEFTEKHNIPLVFDPGQQISAFQRDKFLEILEYSEFLILNKEEMALIKDIFQLKDFEIYNKASYVIITDGFKPINVVNSELNINEYFDTLPAKNPIDPTGCGDAFRAGFFTEYLQSKDIASSVHAGNSLAVKCIGSATTQDY